MVFVFDTSDVVILFLVLERFDTATQLFQLFCTDTRDFCVWPCTRIDRRGGAAFLLLNRRVVCFSCTWYFTLVLTFEMHIALS